MFPYSVDKHIVTQRDIDFYVNMEDTFAEAESDLLWFNNQ